MTTRIQRTVRAAIEERIDKQGPISARVGTRCWIWKGRRNRSGYGYWKLGPGIYLYIHRVVFSWYKGAIPVGRELDHLCCVRACCRPSHLQPVTHRVNMARMRRRNAQRRS